jgi:hypothetical protein
MTTGLPLDKSATAETLVPATDSSDGDAVPIELPIKQVMQIATILVGPAGTGLVLLAHLTLMSLFRSCGNRAKLGRLSVVCAAEIEPPTAVRESQLFSVSNALRNICIAKGIA